RALPRAQWPGAQSPHRCRREIQDRFVLKLPSDEKTGFLWVGNLAQQGVAQFPQRRMLDLPNAFLRDAELQAERFEGYRIVAQAAFPNDRQLALVQALESGFDPA